MMAEYIDREAVVKEQKRFLGYLDDDLLFRLEFAVSRIPAADVRPVVRGKWIVKYPLSTCSVCEKSMILCDFASYCPNCGADMRGEENADN